MKFLFKIWQKRFLTSIMNLRIGTKWWYRLKTKFPGFLEICSEQQGTLFLAIHLDSFFSHPVRQEFSRFLTLIINQRNRRKIVISTENKFPFKGSSRCIRKKKGFLLCSTIWFQHEKRNHCMCECVVGMIMWKIITK